MSRRKVGHFTHIKKRVKKEFPENRRERHAMEYTFKTIGKPHVPRFDERPGAQVGWMEKSFRSGLFRKVSDDRF
jgi:hypothetical protein